MENSRSRSRGRKPRPSNPGNLETMPRIISDTVENIVTPMPRVPWPEPTENTANTAVKTATPDIIMFNDDIIPEEAMVDLILEQIAGQELLLASRNDIVNGQNVIYQPIKNLAKVALRYNSKNILAIQNPSDVIFNNYPIRFEKSVPVVGTGPNGSTIYIDEITSDLVLNVVGLSKDEQIEIQILSTGDLLDDTIYTEENS